MDHTMYVNNETLGNEQYCGTRAEFARVMMPTFRSWYRDQIGEGTFDGTLDEFIEECLDEGLREANEEEIATTERVTSGEDL